MLFVFLCLIYVNADFYGLRYELDIQLAQITITSGFVLSYIGELYKEFSGPLLSAIDNENRIFYFLSYTSVTYVSGINVDNGERVLHLELPFQPSVYGAGDAIQFDEMSGNLIVVGKMMEDDSKYHLVKIDVKTEKIVSDVVVSISDVQVRPDSPSVYLPDENYLFLIHFVRNRNADKYFIDIFSTENGTLIKRIPNDHNIQTMSYDKKTKLIYCIGLKNVSGNTPKRTFLTMDSEGNVKEISQIDGYLDIILALSTINSKEREYYTIMRKDDDPHMKYYFLTIDIDTGKLIGSDPPFCYEQMGIDPTCPFSLLFMSSKSESQL